MPFDKTQLGHAVQDVPLEDLIRNPFRDFDETPVSEPVIVAGVAFFKAHGRWPAHPLGRHHGNQVELAFGHRYAEAATRLGHATIPVTIAELTDAQMVALMPSIGGEHAAQQVEVAIAAWMKARALNLAQTPTELCRLFGWTRPDPRRGKPRMSNEATACLWAEKAIVAGRAELRDFAGRPIYQVKGHAKYLLNRRGTDGFLCFTPEERAGIRKKTVIEADAPLSPSNHPLRYNQRPDCATFSHDTDTLVLMIDQLLQGATYLDAQRGRYIDLVGGHITDLNCTASNLMHLKTAEEVMQIGKVRDALSRLAERAWDLKNQLDSSISASQDNPNGLYYESSKEEELEGDDPEGNEDECFGQEVCNEEATEEDA